MADTSNTGVWIDTKSDKLVESQPEEGIQLVPPGGEVTADVAQRIERERAARSDKQAPAPANKSATKEK